jgi:hypothetical protein
MADRQPKADMKKKPDETEKRHAMATDPKGYETRRLAVVDRQADDVLRFYGRLVESKVPIIQACAMTQSWIGTWRSVEVKHVGGAT